MDGSVRPGNPDRGWNDPPMFNYQTHSQPSPKPNLLNKRVAPPQKMTEKGGTNTTPSLTPRMASAKSTITEVNAPPMTSLKESGPSLVAPPTAACPSSHSSDMEENETGLTLDNIQIVLNECENKLQKRIFDDITKRLGILSEKWTNGIISNTVKIKMSKLAHALLNYHYEEAFKIHLTLMVDHVTEVSQWMVGIKRLIHEAKTIRPQLEEEVSTDQNNEVEAPQFLFDTKKIESSQLITEARELTKENLNVIDASMKGPEEEQS